MRFAPKRLAPAAACLAGLGLIGLSLASCNTVEGLGKDMTAAGTAMQQSSREVQGVDDHKDLDGAPAAPAAPAAPIVQGQSQGRAQPAPLDPPPLKTN